MAILKNPAEKAVPQSSGTVISNKVFGEEVKAPITPPANQATPMLARNSAINLFWPDESLSINNDNRDEIGGLSSFRLQTVSLLIS